LEKYKIYNNNNYNNKKKKKKKNYTILNNNKKFIYVYNSILIVTENCPNCCGKSWSVIFLLDYLNVTLFQMLDWNY